MYICAISKNLRDNVSSISKQLKKQYIYGHFQIALETIKWPFPNGFRDDLYGHFQMALEKIHITISKWLQKQFIWPFLMWLKKQLYGLFQVPFQNSLRNNIYMAISKQLQKQLNGLFQMALETIYMAISKWLQKRFISPFPNGFRNNLYGHF